MTTTIRLQGRPLLLSLCLLLTHGVASGESAEDHWAGIIASETKFREINPSQFGGDMEALVASGVEQAAALADRVNEHQARFPDSPHLDEAGQMRMDFLRVAAMGGGARLTELVAEESRALANPELSLYRRQDIWNHQIERIENLEERERLVRSLREEDMTPTRLPSRPMTIEEAENSLGRRVESTETASEFFARHMLTIARWSDYPRSLEIVDEILEMDPDENKRKVFHSISGDWYYHDQARDLKETLGRIGHPVQLRFTAFDGSEVDLRDYRGKVVLLDFWATWCAPCLVDAPVIRSVWDSLHDRGFEVIGISYDTDRAALERYLGRTGQSWPQFFSDEGNKAPLIQEFGNPPPPTYWLIDQRGVLVDINGFVNLEEKVRRLIAEAEG